MSSAVLRKAIILALILVAAAPALAQGSTVNLSLIGQAAPDFVLAYPTHGACPARKGQEDCVFIAPSGAEYLVFEGTLCKIGIDVAKAMPGALLPYNLKFGDTKSAAAAKLETVKPGGSWFTRDGQDVYAAAPGFFGDPEDLLGLHLWFDAAGQLVRAESQATCV